MTSRPAPMILVASALAAILAGCAPASEPAPTSTGAFADEAEAFAAAEETYRAYVDALNAVDLSDPATFEDVYAWTTGEAAAGEKKSLSQMHADGWVVVGDTEIVTVQSIEADPTETGVEVVMAVCADVHAIDVRDSSGTSMVSPDRPTHQASTVTMVESTESATLLLIASIEGSDAACGR